MWTANLVYGANNVTSLHPREMLKELNWSTGCLKLSKKLKTKKKNIIKRFLLVFVLQRRTLNRY